ncbi:MAG: ABC transporter permease [Bacillus sp. (in: Bacteria)]|nr:ABC transporter permease [Bacillus sp. (in: firmicutes)]MCM1425094.1 ABC transporter permease [Eubacterium sp.]
MASIFTLSILQSALELGCIYSLVALALFISFSILNIADLSTDGCFTLGCAVGAMVTLSGHPFLALFAAMGAGICSGFITAFLQTRMGVPSILAGIIVNTGLYTVNIAVMDFTSTVNLFACDTIFSLAKGKIAASWYDDWYKFLIVFVIVLIIGIVLAWFLNTRLGLSIRATGDNEYMVRASSINPLFMITVGLCVANALTALSGAILGQYQKSCDINLGTGMVTIALASLIIGETLIGKGSVLRKVAGVVLGSCLYRFIVAVALRMNVPAEALKLVSAVIVAVAISFPYLKEKFAFYRQKNRLLRKKGGGNVC